MDMCMNAKCGFIIALIAMQKYFIKGQTVSDFVSEMLDPSVYDKRERPNSANGPTTIELGMYVSSISEISAISMDYNLNMFFRQQWKDVRLAFTNDSTFNDTIALSYRFIDMLWLPDVFIKNEMMAGSFHQVPVPNILLRIDPDGTVVLSQRISTFLSCNMDLRKFPLDTQSCKIVFESYGFTTRDIILEWSHNLELEVKKDLELPEFNLTRATSGTCDVRYATGTFGCIYVEFELNRLFEYYLIQVYIPSVLLVILSWVSFWIDINAVPARVTLGLLTVLTITTQQSGISAQLPRVSYIKAIDVWMFTCMVFVFAALLEYSAVNVLARRQKVWLDSLKKVWSNQEGLPKGLHLATMNQLPILGMLGPRQRNITTKQSQADAEISAAMKIRTAGEAVDNTGALNGYHNQAFANGAQYTTTTPRYKVDPDTPIPPDITQEPAMASVAADQSMQYGDLPSHLLHKKKSYCEKLRKSNALMVDLVSRVTFPLLFLLFNLVYWFHYTD